MGRRQVPASIDQVGFRLIDVTDPAANPNLDFVIRDAAETVAALRAEGKTVLVHCVAAQSRTPTVGVAYAMLRGVEHDRALAEVCGALPFASPNPSFRAALKRLADRGNARLNRPMPTRTNRNTPRNTAPTTWESRLRGLMLGLALGDAVGSRRSDIPVAGMLEAGAATQLAAWTAEGSAAHGDPLRRVRRRQPDRCPHPRLPDGGHSCAEHDQALPTGARSSSCPTSPRAGG